MAFDASNYVYSARNYIVLGETVAVGQTLTEVGIGYSTSSSSLCTHAMLKDANGNQISITKTNTDIINIYATVYIHWGISNVTGDIQILHTDRRNIQLLPYLAGLYDSSWGCHPPECVGIAHGRNAAGISAYKVLTTTYNTSTKTITLAATRMAASECNLPCGIRGLALAYNTDFGDPDIYLASGSAWYTGTDISAEAIGTSNGSTVDFATAFDCPSNAIIYVDGTVNSNVTVNCAPLLYSNMGVYFDNFKLQNGAAYPSAEYAATLGYVKNYAENPFYTYGIKQLCLDNVCYVEVSDDLATWNCIFGNTSNTTAIADNTYTVPVAYKTKRYWHIKTASSGGGAYNLVADTLTGKNIHFATAPASGAVITADYHTPVIAKDANHVFDLTVTIQLGEYSA